ncbi:MAG: hypothetical protein J07HN6_01027 [Halonotius sp. J07HN6]|nr:MAG: hypothetical protein J07HN6_01027 [Halonotius sp. J07HN6]
MRLGVLVNPIAGMGGRVGLKGTDGRVEEARQRGAEPRAPERARRLFDRLTDRDAEIDLSTAAAPMGADCARAAGLDPTVVFSPDAGTDDPETADTAASDTTAAVDTFVEHGVDLVAFVGGDGTAADVADTLADSETPLLGVPAGVKVLLSVVWRSHRSAAMSPLISTAPNNERSWISTRRLRDASQPELRAVAGVPVADDLQSAKQRGGGSVDALAAGIAADMDSETTYVLGPGSTLAAIKRELGFDGSPLGVDVWRDGEVLVSDATESEILDALGEQSTIIVSPIGGQGFVFGRGNPQLSPAVIRRCEVEIVGSQSKLDELRALRADTDDPDLDADLRGWWQVRVGRVETRLMKLV